MSTESPKWLDLYWQNGHLMLTSTNRAVNLLNGSQKTHIDGPFPLFISLNAVGTLSSEHLKNNFLQKADVGKCQTSHSALNLYLNDADEPILFLDSTLSGAESIENYQKEHVNHVNNDVDIKTAPDSTRFRLGRFSISELSGSGRKVTDNIYYQLTAPFTDLYCIFADDIGLAASQILHWLSFGAVSVSHQSVKPAVLVVLEKDGADEELKLIGQILLEILQYHNNRDNRDPLDAFSSIQVVLAGKTRSSMNSLYSLALRNARKVHQQKRKSYLSFSIRHTLVFHHQLCERMTQREPVASEPFDFIREARVHNPEPDSKLFSNHLQNIIQTAQKDDLFVGPLAEAIGYSLVLDALPPGMHFFHPSDVFKTFYRKPLTVAVNRISAFSGLGEHFVARVAQIFEKNAFLSVEASALTIIQSMPESVRLFWRKRFSEITCFLCSKSAPEIPLPCQHSICSNCTLLFGKRDTCNPWIFNFLSCPLCGISFNKQLGITVKPPTAGYRLLCIDGGGARGVVPLQILVELQKTLALRIPIQEHFDLSFGTSSGALIILALFVHGWTETFCMDKFIQLLYVIFGKQNTSFPRFSIPFLHSLRKLVFSFLADSKYSARRIESALQSVFGSERSLIEGGLEYPGKRFGVVATTIRGSVPCIFSNYNNVSSQLVQYGYRLVKPKVDKIRIKLWEAARCSSAAPWFFTPKVIDGVGTFQDGGLTHNNPVNLALWEAASIWPSSQLDIVLSLGTGSTASTDPPSPASLSGTQGRKDGFIPRLYRTFMNSLDGQRSWLDLINRIPYEARWRYQRLNVTLDGTTEPDIDDLSEIDNMRNSTTRQLNPLQMDKLCSTMLAASFYLELTREPSPAASSNLIQTSAKILCRIQSKHHGILQSHMAEKGYQFYIDNVPVNAECSKTPIEFFVQSLTAEFRITISNGSDHFEIGGSPFTLESLSAKQWPFSPFGCVSHRQDPTISLSGLKRKLNFYTGVNSCKRGKTA